MKPIGLHADRLKGNRENPREVAFVAEWHREHSYRDLLAMLFQVPCAKDDPDVIRISRHTTCGPYREPLGKPTERDRIVAETVVQWLGSNVGLSFVMEALKREGYGVTYPESVMSTERFHPGEYLREELAARGWSVDALAEKSGLRRNIVDELLAERRPVTRLIAVCLEDALGTNAETWTNLQKAYDAKP